MEIQQNTFELLLNFKPFLIPSKFDRLTKVSSRVYNQLIFNSTHQYTIESNVSEEVLQLYIDYWINEKIPNITINNFYEYSSLSQEFGLLVELVEKKKEEFGEDLEFYKGLTDPNNQFQSEYVEQVTKNLDKYLEKYGAEMMKLPARILFNIFNHHNRILTNHNLVYDLIQIEYKHSKDPNIFVLLSCLDGTKLNQDNLEDSIRSAHSRCGFMPKIDGTCLYTALEKQKTMEKQMIELQQLVNSQNSKMEQFISEFSKIKNDQDIEIENLKKIIQNQANEISNNKDSNDKNFSNILQFIKNQATEAIDYKQKNDSNINEIVQFAKKQANELSNYGQKTNKSINEISQAMTNQNNEISSHKETINQNIEELKNAIKIQANKINLLEDNQEQNIIKINESKAKMNDAIKKQNDRMLIIQTKFEELLNKIATRRREKINRTHTSSQDNSPNQNNSSSNKNNQNKSQLDNDQNIGEQKANLMSKDSLNQKYNNISSPRSLSSINNQSKISSPIYYDFSSIPKIDTQNTNPQKQQQNLSTPKNAPNDAKEINAKVIIHANDLLNQYQEYQSPRLNQKDNEISSQNNSYMSYQSYLDKKAQMPNSSNLSSFNVSSDSDDQIFPIFNKNDQKSSNHFNPLSNPQAVRMMNESFDQMVPMFNSSSDQYDDQTQDNEPNIRPIRVFKRRKKPAKKKVKNNQLDD